VAATSPRLQRLIKAGENLQIVARERRLRYRLDEAAKPTGAKAYMKHADLLANPEVDAVCIATPDRLHVPQAIDAIRAGKDVYCEKPMGTGRSSTSPASLAKKLAS